MPSSGNTFFINWELWQQMTFVLAAAICVVFILGLSKLAYQNSLMKKQELLDEEKRHRVQEMESSGLSHKRAINIPFGVRAIQGGVEVDGIWISRPTTPNTRKSMAPGLASTTTIAVTASPLLAKANARGGKLPSPTDPPTKMENPTPYMPTGYSSGQPKSPGHHDPMSPLGGPPNLNRNPSGHHRSSSQNTKEDALSRLEGSSGRQPLRTYVPKATPSTAPQLQQHLGAHKPQPRLPPQQPQARQQAPPPPPPRNSKQQKKPSPLRDSASSSDSYASGAGGPSSEHHLQFEGAQRARVISLSHFPSQSSSRVAAGSSTRPPSSTSGPGSPGREWGASSSSSSMGPYGHSTPSLPQSSFPAPTQSETRLPLLAQDPHIQMPEPTFGPGDLRHNSGRPRRANQSFEGGSSSEFIATPLFLDRSVEDDSQRGSSARQQQQRPYGQQ
ncbi:hypothetical protein RB601_007697 [Gaeumannomyces tritici]